MLSRPTWLAVTTKGKADTDIPITADSPTGSTALEVVTLKGRCLDLAVGLDLGSMGPNP